KNVGIIDPEVNSTGVANNHGTGALVGSLRSATVEHAFVRGGTITGRRAGGVVGAIVSTAAKVVSCYSQGATITCIPASETGTTVGANGSAGGVVGYNNIASSTISNCYAASTTAVTGSKTVEAAVLGLSTQNITMTHCYGVNDTEIKETNLYRVVSGKTVTVKNVDGTTSLYPAATIKAGAATIGAEYAVDYLEINAGFPIFWCEDVFQDLVKKIAEGKPVLDGKYADGTNVQYFAAIMKYQPELIAVLDTAIKQAENYLTADTTTDNSGMQPYIDNITAAIEAIRAADQEYINNPGSIEALNITVFSPPILTLASDGTYATGQTVRVKSNYLITGALTLTGGNDAGMNNVTLTPVEDYDTEGEGDELLYVYTFEIAGGTPETVTDNADTEEIEATNTTVTFNATASSNGLEASASATSTFLTGVGSKTFDVKISGQYNREDWWGSVETKTYLKNHYAIVGLHGYTDPEKTSYYKDYGTDDGEGSSKTYGSQSSPTAVGATGYFYHDKNNSNKLGVASGSTKTSSVGIAFIPEADSSHQRYEQSTLKADLTNYLTETTVNTHGATEIQYKYNKDVDSGQDDTITYTMYFMVEANDESTNTIHNYSQFTVDIIQVDTTALWNLYNYETNKINKTNRFEYKELYQQANPEAWAAYEAAYLNAAQVLQGGVPQETIDAAFEQFLAAVLGLGTLIKYDLNGGEGTIPESHNVPIYRDVIVSSLEVVAPEYHLNDVYLTDLAPYDGITRTGYDCIGWSLKKDATEDDLLSGYLTLPKDAINRAVTLYATWKPHTYTIKYDGNKPANLEAMLTGVPTDQTATYDVPMNLTEATPQLTNHKFMGWNTKADGSGDMYDKGAEVVNLTAEQDGTVTLYAQWAPATSKTVFLLNLPEGAVLTENSKLKEDTEADLTIGSNVSLADYALEASGWRHIGWATQAVATTPQYTDTFNVPQTATNLYAVWQKKAMTVFYSGGEGITIEWREGEYTKANESVNCGEAVTLPSADDVYRKGWTLGGWKSSIDGQFYQGSYIIPDSTVTEVTFTAEWFKRTTTITLHHNNNATEDVTTEIKGQYESELDSTLFITPEKTDVMAGYTFIGWYELTENGYVEYTKPTTFPADDIDLYAAWSMDALSAELERFPADVEKFVDYNNDGVYDEGVDIYYYQEPGKTNAINEKAEAVALYGEGENGGKLYNWELIDDVNTATVELRTAIDALIENPADYTVVDQYRTYYYEMTLNDPSDAYNDVHIFNYNGVDYEVTKDTFTAESFAEFEKAVEAVVNGKGIKNQADVDSYAADLIEAYNNLTLKPADYSEFNFFVEQALKLNTDFDTGETALDPDILYQNTEGYKYYESGSWENFYVNLAVWNIELTEMGELTILDQQIINDYVAMLNDLWPLELLPADFYEYLYVEHPYIAYKSATNEIEDYDATYQKRVTDVISKMNEWYTEDYVQRVMNADKAVTDLMEYAKLRDDQDVVNAAITALGEILADPTYMAYNLIFALNDGTDAIADTKLVPWNESVRGKAPTDDPQREGYLFLGWYTTPEDTEDAVGTRIDFETTERIMGVGDLTLYARWEKELSAYTLDVSATYSNVYVTLGENGESLQGNKYRNDEVVYGTKVTLRAVPDGDNREFLYWKDVGPSGTRGRIVSYDETLTFTLEADWYLVAVYSEAKESGYYSVAFVDSILKTVLSEVKVKAGEAAKAPDIAETHGEYTFVKWNADFDAVTENMIITSVYELTDELFTITTVIGEETTEETYRYNSPVTVEIEDKDIPEGKVFAGWTVNGKDVVSYDRTYKFFAYKDMTVTAIFADEEVKADATVTLDITTNPAEPSNGKDTYNAEFMVTRDVPDDFVFVSSGLLLTQDETLANEDDLTFEGQTDPENTDKIRLYRTVYTGNTGQYQLTVRTYTDRAFWARGYVVYINGDGELITLYTEVKKATASN
ncbi:MAG: InlB B-repeat-containing protein, partial [Clostridia bacterium]|nr:InlB B-repeat-containing protein [Clostridia bacterium]